MVNSQLRVYNGPESDEASVAFESNARTVSVSLGEIFPLLADAVECERTWLKDFQRDEISISSDLYDVLMAYQHYRRPGA